MRVLSLFDGMSCGRLALDRAGIPVTQYLASEIDKYAITVARANYPDTIHLGDVRVVRAMAEAGVFGRVDILIGGSPCQGFSFAGKQLAFDDPRSALFFEFVHTLNALRRHNPNIRFMLENVKMKKEHLAVISQMLGVEPVCINSALVSAQNRVRYYWCNWSVSQPADRGILLRDIIETGNHPVESEGWHKWFAENKDFQLKKKYSTVLNMDDKAICMTARQYASYNGNFLTVSGARIVGRKVNPETGKREDYNPNLTAAQRLELREDGKAGCMTSVQKDSVVAFSQSEARLMVREATHRHFQNMKSLDDKSFTLLSSMYKGAQANGQTLISPQDGITYRKLTPTECERLQTVPDGYTAHVSNTQRYKMLGNGWTVDVISHILSEMPK